MVNVDPVPPPRKTNWIPSQKAISGGLAGIVTFFVVTAAQYYGYAIPAELQAAIPGAITWLVYYLVPAADADIVRNLDNHIVALAVHDPTSPVSQPAIATAVMEVSAEKGAGP